MSAVRPAVRGHLRVGLPVALVVAVVAGGLLSGCIGGRIVCAAAPVTDATAAGVSAPLPLTADGLPPVPGVWVERARGRLTVAAPPPASARSQFLVDTPGADGSTCTTWNGALFGNRADALGELDVTPGGRLPREVVPTAQGFTAVPVPGAAQAVARIVDEPYRDGGGYPVGGQRATGLEAFVVAGGQLYRLSLTLPPGPDGVTAAQQVVTTLRLT